jgi:hypothetical protein
MRRAATAALLLLLLLLPWQQKAYVSTQSEFRSSHFAMLRP